MDRIVIEVDDATARRWRNILPSTKERISKKLDGLLGAILEKEDDEIWPFLEKVRREAEAKGFNDDIMNQILSEE